MKKSIFTIFVVGLIKASGCWGVVKDTEQDWEQVTLFGVVSLNNSLRSSPDLDLAEESNLLLKEKKTTSQPQQGKSKAQDHKREASARRYQARRILQDQSPWKTVESS